MPDDLPPADTPTTMRFSRRAGEAWPDAAYARAIEGPHPAPHAGEWTLLAATMALLLAGAGLLWT